MGNPLTPESLWIGLGRRHSSGESYVRQKCIFQKMPRVSQCAHIMQALERDVAGNDLLYNWPKDRSLFTAVAEGV